MPKARLKSYRKVAVAFAAVLSMMVSSFFVSPAFADAKVAFIGDQGTGEYSRRVLELIRDEGTELLLIQGDMGYEDDSASKWIDNIEEILGEDFPVLLVVGNHENHEWDAYLDWQEDRLDDVSEIRCEGDTGVKYYCTYEDIGVVFVAPGINEVEGVNGADDYEGFISEQFAEDDSVWRICSWHKNMRDMQVGGKGDATGWGVYQNCLDAGAIVVNGHEHSYSRTYLMSDFENLDVEHTGSEMDIGPGRSFTVVSGLGGYEVRPQQHGGDWFASIYTSTQNANHGALFCDFEGASADCYMKDIAGLVPDTFSLKSSLPAALELEADRAEAEREAEEEQARLEAEAQAEREAEEAAEAQAEREAEEAAEAQAEREAEEAAEAQAEREAEEAAEAQAEREAEEAAEAQAEREAEEAAEAQAEREAEEAAESAAQAQREADEAAAQQQRALESAPVASQSQSDSAQESNDPLLAGVPTGIADGASLQISNAASLPPPYLQSAADEADNGATDSAAADAILVATDDTEEGGGSLHWISLLALLSVACLRRSKLVVTA